MARSTLRKLVLVLSLVVSFIGVSKADTYKAYTYQNLSEAPGVDEEMSVVPLVSTDQYTMTIQALMLQKKLRDSETIRSIRSSKSLIDTAPNMIVELEDRNTGRCRAIGAVVKSGYMDENGKEMPDLQTWVKFVPGPKRCN